MPAAAEGRARHRLTRRLFAICCLAALLAGCNLSRQARPTATPSPLPRHAPSPTVQVRSSDELYAGDQRAIGGTRQDLAALAAGAVLPPAPLPESPHGVTVALDKNASLPGRLHAPQGRRLPALLLLGGDIDAWGDLPARLAQHGFVALALETTPSLQARQLETMLQSLIALPAVDPGRIGVLGAGEAADLALLGCAINSLCDALALISPASQASLLNVMPSYGARPLWLAAREGDRAAAALAEAAAGDARLVTVAEQGALLPAHAEVQAELISWLGSQLARDND